MFLIEGHAQAVNEEGPIRGGHHDYRPLWGKFPLRYLHQRFP